MNQLYLSFSLLLQCASTANVSETVHCCSASLQLSTNGAVRAFTSGFNLKIFWWNTAKIIYWSFWLVSHSLVQSWRRTGLVCWQQLSCMHSSYTFMGLGTHVNGNSWPTKAITQHKNTLDLLEVFCSVLSSDQVWQTRPPTNSISSGRIAREGNYSSSHLACC